MAKQDPRTAHLNRLGEILFPQWQWWIILAVIGAFTAVNLGSMLWAWNERRRSRSNFNNAIDGPSRNGTSSWRKIPSAVITFSRIVSFRYRIPFTSLNITEAFLTAAYLSIQFAFNFSNTEGLSPRLWANRAGHLAAAQMPLLVALATKNNIIGMMTGLGHEKINIMHRIASRAVLILVWVHMFGRVVINQKSMFNETWKVIGMAAGMMYTFMTVVSLQPVRKHFYEWFVITHILLATGFLILTQYHCAEPGFGYYIWPCWIIWFLDRSMRTLRLFFDNFVFRNDSWTSADAIIEPHACNTTRVTIRRRFPLGWTAGQHAFLKFPTLGMVCSGVLESHPFTMASTDEVVGEKGEREMIFIIRAQDGMTRRLFDEAMRSPGGKIAALVEGPYGAPPDVTPYTTCVFVAGGSGVSYTLPRFEDVLKKAGKGKAVAKRVAFVWVIRDEAEFEWISKSLYQAVSTAPSSVSLSVYVYVTSESTSPAPSTPESPDEKEYDGERGTLEDKVSFSNAWDMWNKSTAGGVFKRRGGRPDVKALLEEEVRASEGAVTVDVSGPNGLVDHVREALSGSFASPMAALKGEANVHLNIEQFKM